MLSSLWMLQIPCHPCHQCSGVPLRHWTCILDGLFSDVTEQRNWRTRLLQRIATEIFLFSYQCQKWALCCSLFRIPEPVLHSLHDQLPLVQPAGTQIWIQVSVQSCSFHEGCTLQMKTQIPLEIPKPGDFAMLGVVVTFVTGYFGNSFLCGGLCAVVDVRGEKVGRW